MLKLMPFFILWIFSSCNHPVYKNPHVLVETRLGEIEIELFPDKAPKTVAAFLANIEAGVYKKTSFYRVVKADELPTSFNTGIIQGGLYGPGANRLEEIMPIAHESTKQTGLSHQNGSVSFASLGAGTATTEFFICIGDQSFLDAGRGGTADNEGYAVFGKLFAGMDIVKKIQNQNSLGDKFDKEIEILNIKRL